MSPRYLVAKFTMELATVAGVLLIIIAILGTTIHHHINGSIYVDYLVAGVIVINGIAIIEAAQMGTALLDKAISTREIDYNIKIFINKVKPFEITADSSIERSKPLWAQR